MIKSNNSLNMDCYTNSKKVRSAKLSLNNTELQDFKKLSFHDMSMLSLPLILMGIFIVSAFIK